MTERIASQEELEGLVLHGDLVLSTYGGYTTEEAREYKPDHAFGLPVYEDNDYLAALEFNATTRQLHELESEAATDLLLPNSEVDNICFAFLPKRYAFPPEHPDDMLVGEAFAANWIRNRNVYGTYAIWRDAETGKYGTEAFISLDGINQTELVVSSLACSALHRLIDCIPRIAEKKQ
jgi:hypothetical protein